MLPRNIWIIASLLAVATMTNCYTHKTYNSPSPPTTSIPENRHDYDRSDPKEAWAKEGRIIVPGPPIQSPSRREDYETTDVSTGAIETSRALFTPPNDRTPVNFNPNPNHGHHHQGNFQPVEYNRDYPQNYNGPSQFNQEQPNQGRPASFNSDTSGLNNGQFFKVQRNPDGKLNVVFNDTAIPHEKDDEAINLNSRGSGLRPPAQIGPINPPARGKRDMIYPDDPQLKSLSQKNPPRCAETGKLFCTDVENYPKELVANAKNRDLVKFQELFGRDLLQDFNTVDLGQRVDAPNEESLCVSTETIIYPKAGLTKDNNWQFIVNQENYTQGIRVEECSSPGQKCTFADSFPSGYETECRQKFIYRHLVSVNDAGEFGPDLFKIPSCCKCILKNKNFM